MKPQYAHLARKTALVLLGASAMLPACLDRTIETIEPNTTASYFEPLTQTRIDKIDLLLAIDSSGSMSDKQTMLARAVPKLVTALVNPACVDQDGKFVMRPASAAEECPAALHREFKAVKDIHIGIISSSLGNRGGDACDPDLNDDGHIDSPYADDRAHLVSRIDPEDPTQTLPTYDDHGFLVWEPESPDTSDGLYKDVVTLGDDMGDMVRGVSDKGCGLEAQLESWYRFLVDPSPYESVERSGGKAVLTGTDDELLAQRDEFLRPDSLVAIVMLSDENDCSFDPTSGNGTGWHTASLTKLAPQKARSECAVNPGDACCAPCGQEPESCPADPACAEPEPDENWLSNLGCMQQKQRFGVDHLYPTQRYVAGLTSYEITDRKGNPVPNPLLVSDDGLRRPTDRVFFAGIVGVPWQLVARDAADISAGYKNADELAASGTWDRILGDPQAGVPPSDPHMVEAIHPRAGLPGPDSAPDADPMNGHEHTVFTDGAKAKAQSNAWLTGDLQYACTFPLTDPIDCTEETVSCDCAAANDNDYTKSVLCQADDGSYDRNQRRAKAYPGLRQLSVLKGIKDQGVVASICPAAVDGDENAPQYGYTPAVDAIIERLKEKLGGPCLPRALHADERGQVACIVMEGRNVPDGDSCACDYAPGRTDVDPQHQSLVTQALTDPSATLAGLDCFCEIEQLEGPEANVCRTSLDEAPELDGEPVQGWCYIDGTSVPQIGNPELVEHCAPTEQRMIRFANRGEPVNDSVVFVSCLDKSN
jgi:hypothetical protein